MKVKIWRRKSTPGSVVELKLVTTITGVSLIAVGPNGRCVNAGVLLRIQNDGTSDLCENVSRSLGFDLDSKGRLKVTGEQ